MQQSPNIRKQPHSARHQLPVSPQAQETIFPRESNVQLTPSETYPKSQPSRAVAAPPSLPWNPEEASERGPAFLRRTRRRDGSRTLAHRVVRREENNHAFSINYRFPLARP